MLLYFFFFNDTATTEIYTLSPTRRSSDLAAVDGRAEEARDGGVALVLQRERERRERLVAVAPEARVRVLEARELLEAAEARAYRALPELAEEVRVAQLEAAERARVRREADDR